MNRYHHFAEERAFDSSLVPPYIGRQPTSRWVLSDRIMEGMPHMRGRTEPFPDTFADVDTHRLLDAYARGPERVRAALRGVPDDRLRAHPIPGKWSIVEIAAHVADSELIGTARIRLVLGGDTPVLPGYDQDRWCGALGYQRLEDAGLAHVLDLFAALRATTLPLLQTASPDDWRRSGRHPEYGGVTLRNLLELYADHSERHVAQIVERRALLECPIALPPLLPERLY